MTPVRNRPLSVSQWTLREPDAARGLDRLAAAGYAAVEVSGTAPTTRAERAAIGASGLSVTSVCPLLGARHDLAADDPRVRRRATDVLRAWADVARELGTDVVIVVPSDRPEPETPAPRADLLARSAESLSAAIDDGTGPTFVIEALNGSETHLVRTLDEAEQLRALVGSPRVALMADLHHMSIEEDSLVGALRRHAAGLRHVHLADSRRGEPGSGSVDFAAVLQTLDEIGYAGALTMEFLPTTDSALRRARAHVEGLIGGTGD